ncbi:type IV conjugative transfer system lipoprotein TraV [Photobacterium leiognathi]|uniref:type IV conjugative transfer system lipoprotein TraV n=1 Tax=Photobacterium leiognathi TaxID=553611 RepID=UPI0029810512|nr:type IV conjugative transfer system lipoprotein TraV [Photobacterium leiognathi]
MSLSKKILTLVSPLLLAGCSIGQSEFNCSAGDDNALCGSTTAIITATNGELATNDTIRVHKDGEVVEVSASKFAGFNQNNLDPEHHQAQLSDVDVPHTYNYDGDALRTKEQVLRVWIAPWIEQDDVLHMSNVLYTDVQKRHWKIVNNSNAGMVHGLQPNAIPHKKIVSKPKTESKKK